MGTEGNDKKTKQNKSQLILMIAKWGPTTHTKMQLYDRRKVFLNIVLIFSLLIKHQEKKTVNNLEENIRGNQKTKVIYHLQFITGYRNKINSIYSNLHNKNRTLSTWDLKPQVKEAPQIHPSDTGVHWNAGFYEAS